MNTWFFDMLPERAFMKIGGRMTYEGGGKGGSAPPAPDYAGAAKAEGKSAQQINAAQTWANRPEQFTPWGSSTWDATRTKDPATGKPVTSWSQTLNVDPELQQALDSQIAVQSGRSGIAENLLPRVGQEMAGAWDYSRFTPRSGGVNTPDLDAGRIDPTTQSSNEALFSADRQRIENAAFDRMAPEHQRRQAALDTKLSNQGITAGSEAYQKAQQDEADLQARERWNALTYGGDEQARMEQMLLSRQGQAFGQDVTSKGDFNQTLQSQQGVDITGANFNNNLRQQEIAEELQRRGMSLNEINALLTGQQVQTPSMPGFVTAQKPEAPQFLQAAQLAGQHGLDVFNTQQAGKQGLMSGLFGLGSTAMQIFGGS